MAPEGIAVKIPLINPNEPEAQLSALVVADGQLVQAGDALCTLETTKATQDLHAETGGYVVGINFQTGQTVRAGEILCYLSEDPEWEPPDDQSSPEDEDPADKDLPDDLRITQPARKLVSEFGLDPAALPRGILLTESHIRGLVDQPGMGSSELPSEEPLDPNKVVVYGAGGHGKAVIDLIRAEGIFKVHGVIDDSLPPGEPVLDVSTLGGRAALAGLYARGIRQAANAVGGIGDIRIRVQIFDVLRAAGFHCPELIHPRAVVEPSAQISAGVQVFPQAYVGTDAALGFGVIVNTGAIISHDCQVTDYANISPGAILAGAVHVGEGCLVGMGATLNLGVRAGAGARIGNGATVKEDVPENGLVPAGTIWPR